MPNRPPPPPPPGVPGAKPVPPNADGPAGLNPLSIPETLTSPNILIILTDQFRYPQWLTSSQMSRLDQPDKLWNISTRSAIGQSSSTTTTWPQPPARHRGRPW